MPLGLVALSALESACVQEPMPEENPRRFQVLLSAHATAPSANGLFGDVVAGLADVDGDGVRDFAVVSGGAQVNFAGGSYDGQATVVSGRSGAPLFDLTDPDPQLQEPDRLFGHSLLGLDDLDGDGIAEIAVGARRYDGARMDQGRVYVYRGADGSLLRAIDGPLGGFFFGSGLARTDDVDADGSRDLLVTAIVGGHAYLVSAQTGATLRVFDSPTPFARAFFGWSYASLGDIDADGVGDIALGEIALDANNEDGTRIPGSAGNGHVYLYSGSGALLATLVSPSGQDQSFGFGLTTLGDIDGDGVRDLAIASTLGVSVVSAGRLGTPLYAINSESLYFGEVMSSVPDLDCDGVPELAVSARDCGPPGAVYFYSGASGASLLKLNPSWTAGARVGRSLSLLEQRSSGDVDMVIGATGEGVLANEGRAFVVRLSRKPGCKASNSGPADVGLAWP
ncbi:MAG: hypothetical protein WDO74_02700 [Pseudomonadota bacterium]